VNSVNSTFKNLYSMSLLFNIQSYVFMIIMIKYFVVGNFKGTCTSVEMLKRCIVSERLGTPVLN